MCKVGKKAVNTIQLQHNNEVNTWISILTEDIVLEAILNMAAILKSPMSLSHSICRKNFEYQFMLMSEYIEILAAILKLSKIWEKNYK